MKHSRRKIHEVKKALDPRPILSPFCDLEVERQHIGKHTWEDNAPPRLIGVPRLQTEGPDKKCAQHCQQAQRRTRSKAAFRMEAEWNIHHPMRFTGGGWPACEFSSRGFFGKEWMKELFPPHPEQCWPQPPKPPQDSFQPHKTEHPHILNELCAYTNPRKRQAILSLKTVRQRNAAHYKACLMLAQLAWKLTQHAPSQPLTP
jgi:hypothetical protein